MTIKSINPNQKMKRTPIGEIPSDWEVVKLKDIARIEMGQSPSSITINDECNGIPFLQGNAEFTCKFPNAKLWCNTPIKIAEKNDVLMSVRAPVGALNIADQKYCIGRGLSSIRFTDADNKFGWYVLQKSIQYLQRYKQGSTFDAINKSVLENVQCPLPPYEQQKYIADILSSVDYLIEKTQAVIDQTQIVKKGLMQQLFTRGIPGRHKKFKKYVLGEHCQILGGGTPSTKNQDYWKGTIPWITSADIENIHDIHPKKFINKTAIRESATNLIPKDNIIVVTRVGLGKVAINHFDVCISQDSQGVIPDKDIFDTDYLAYYLNIIAQKFITTNQGTAIKGVLKEDLLSLVISCPDIEEQIKIAKILTIIDTKIEILNKFIAEILNVKFALMKVLLTGKIRLKV